MRDPVWTGQAAIGDGWASFCGVSGDNAVHAHHALQLAVALEGDVSLWIAGIGLIAAPAVLVNADLAHRLNPCPVRLLYVDRQSVLGRELASACPAGFLRLGEAGRTALLSAWQDPDLVRRLLPLVSGSTSSFPPATPAVDSNDRVWRLVQALAGRPSFDGGVERLAAEVALSPSRFRHRVKALLGMPVRPYLRWLRLRRALTLAAGGASLTRSAQDAGFADAAHLTRTVRRHFGVTPTEIVRLLRPGAADATPSAGQPVRSRP